MSGSFDETFLAEVRDRNDIVSVVGDYVTLRKAGTSYKGLCPFHGEKTPSFHVHPDRGFFYCFGCQTGGDVLTFVREINGYSFPEAVRHLAERAGMAVPERPAFGAPFDPQKAKAGTASRAARDGFYQVNKAAWRFYATTLETLEGVRCRDYLGSRGIEKVTVERFGLGYAPDRWDGLTQHLTREGYKLETAETLGLLVRRQGSTGYYDRFRHRLMFPIRNLAGEVIGFSGRIVPGDSATEKGHDGGTPAKYVNSPESPVYQKGDNVYGLHEARAAMRKSGRALLVEGNVDLVRLAQAGLEEVVAPLGTALTAAQCRLMKRFVEHAVAIYDGDNAGREAAKKAATLALAEGLPISIATLPAKEDPDSYVKTHGRAALELLIERAVPGWEHLVDRAMDESRALENAQGAKLAIEKLAAVLASVEDVATRGLYERKLAELLRIDPNEVQAIARAAARRAPAQTVGPAVQSARVAQAEPEIPVPDSEARLLELLLLAPTVRPLYMGRDVGALVSHPTVRRLADALADHEGDPVQAMEVLPEGPIRDRLLRRMAEAAALDEPLVWFERLVKSLRREAIERKLDGLRREERRAYLSRDDAMVMQLVSEKTRLQKQLESLKLQ